jgi:hypothetical protein
MIYRTSSFMVFGKSRSRRDTVTSSLQPALSTEMR